MFVAATPAAGTAAAVVDPDAAADATWLTVGGPAVPDTAAFAAIVAASNVPVMPVKVNRPE